MRVLWFVNIVLPVFAEELGESSDMGGGWMPSLLKALRTYAPNIELMVACKFSRNEERTIGGVRYVALSRVREEALALVRRFNPDVIHVHGSEVIAQELPDEVLQDVRTVLSIQGVINGCAPHYNGGIVLSELSKDRNWIRYLLGKASVPRMQKFWLGKRSQKEREVFCKVRTVLGRTDWDEAWARYLNPNVNYCRVGELLREPFYWASRSSADIRRHTIYCSSAFSYSLKGGHWLIRAVSALKKKYPDVQLRVADAWRIRTPVSFFDRLKWLDYHRYVNRLIRELGVEENVVLLGSLSAVEVRDELARAEVFCLPSLCENSPNSLAEAQMVGVPCVAADVGGIQSMIDSGRSGLLVPSADPAAMVQAIARVFEDVGFAGEIVQTAAMIARERHKPERIVKDLVLAYQSI